jgi:predicted peroxiredoxin
MTRRFWLGLFILAAFALTAALASLATRHALAAPHQAPSASPRPLAATAKAPLFFNLTSGKNGVHGISMALGLAADAAAQGHEVVVFLNVEAPPFAARGLGDDVKVADFPPVKTLLAQVIANGGKVLVCDHCARVCNVDQTALINGVTFASHADILGQIKPGTVCFSY